MRRQSVGVCPVCLRRVWPTVRGNIAYHRDSVGRDQCPAAGQPYEITGAAPQRKSGPVRP